jgi:hypothetical protein
LGTVFLFIPLVGQIAIAGYQAEIFQRLVRRDPTPMPRLSFDDFSRYLSKGVGAYLAQLAIFFGLGAMMMPIFGMVGGVLVVTAKHGHPSPAPIFALWAVMMFAMLVLTPLVQATSTRAAMVEDVGPTLQLGPLLRYARGTFGAALVGLVAYSVLSIPVLLGGGLLCAVGLYPAIVILQLGAVHLRWQIYEAHVARGGEAIPMKIAPNLAPQFVPPRPMYAFQEEQAPAYYEPPRQGGRHGGP